jgi:hypothetical protein
VDEEGLYRDPYGTHDDRWFSKGEPTKFVRDSGAESYDPPSGQIPPGPLIPAAGALLDRSDEENGTDVTERRPEAELSPRERQWLRWSGWLRSYEERDR